MEPNTGSPMAPAPTLPEIPMSQVGWIAQLQTVAVSWGLPEAYRDYIDRDHLLIVVLILYTAYVSIWTPRAILQFANHPVIRIVCLLLVVWVFSWNKLLAIMIAIAFVATLSIDQSMILSQVARARKAIVDRSLPTEHFITEEDADEDVEDNAEDEHPRERFEDEDDHGNEEDNAEHMEGDAEDDEDAYEDDHHLKDKQLTDTFRNLHDSIHQLEQFIAKQKKAE